MGTLVTSAPSESDLYAKTAVKIAGDIKAVLASSKHCAVGIVGGHTEGGLLDHLVPLLKGVKGRIDIHWLDERVHIEKNYLAAQKSLEKLRAGMVEVYWHPLRSVDPKTAVAEANKTLAHITERRGKPLFDVIICSAGEDGHIASIFPKSKILVAKEVGYALVENAPKAPPVRVTVTPPLLLTARSGYLFFVGAKQRAYRQFIDAAVPVKECPARLLQQLPNLTVCTCLG